MQIYNCRAAHACTLAELVQMHMWVSPSNKLRQEKQACSLQQNCTVWQPTFYIFMSTPVVVVHRDDEPASTRAAADTVMLMLIFLAVMSDRAFASTGPCLVIHCSITLPSIGYPARNSSTRISGTKLLTVKCPRIS